MFITFEGIDGSGKSTQIELLKSRLIETNQAVEVFREPGGTAVSEKIRELLLEPDFSIHPVTELLLFSAARSQLVAEEVLPLLKSGTVVILDRFYDSTIAYQGYGRASVSLEQIAELNDIASHQTEPHLTFYLKISLKEAQKRTATMEKDRMEQSGNFFYKKVIEGFDALARQEERIVTLDATLSPEELHNRIWNHVSDHPQLS